MSNEDFAKRIASATEPIDDYDFGIRWIPPAITRNGRWEAEPLQVALPARITKEVEIGKGFTRIFRHIHLEAPCA